MLLPAREIIPRENGGLLGLFIIAFMFPSEETLYAYEIIEELALT